VKQGVIRKGHLDMTDTEEFRWFKQHRGSFATAELSDERVQAIIASRMDERHAHVDAVLELK
jgi:hypothetical protein